MAGRDSSRGGRDELKIFLIYSAFNWVGVRIDNSSVGSSVVSHRTQFWDYHRKKQQQHTVRPCSRACVCGELNKFTLAQ